MDLRELPCYVEGFDPGVNLRDLGGWPACGGTVRRGLVFRSARLDVLDTDELVSLLKLGLRYVVDLRPEAEAALHPDPRFPSVVRVPADMGRDAVLQEEMEGRAPEEVVALAARNTAAMAFGNPGIARVLALLEEGSAPLLFHCNSGRDRSGVAAMVVLMALGCDDDVLLADYELSNVYRAQELAYVRARYAKALSLGAGYADIVTLMAGVLPQVGRGVLAAIDERYPSREEFLKAEYGLDAERVANLRARYVS